MTSHLKTRRMLLGAMAMSAAFGTLKMARAANYPTHPVRFVNPFAPGGSADVLSRLMASKIGPLMGGSLFVENVSGAGGTIGSDKVAKADPDGYTLLLSNVAPLAIAPALYRNLAYDPVRDFSHVALFGQFPNVLVVGPRVQAHDFKEFIAQGKARQGKDSYYFGSAGNGSSPHLCGELLKMKTGIHAEHVPYRGAGPALVAVMAGELDFQFENISTAIPQIKSGKLRAFGVTSAKRNAALPDVPTMGELGVPEFVVGAWYGLAGPKGLPPAIHQTLAKAIAQALADKELQARLVELGVDPPEALPDKVNAFIAAEVSKWADVVKRSGTTVN
ncbi:Bug family tripartite tricarboxylate transporter substrate binding protein [Bordetella genomosp. 8]|nr:tripartite tricarboxylate transporter substrate binding protein [Bordetella genomosp. 8]